MVGFEGKYGGCRGGGELPAEDCGGSLSFLRNLPRLFSNVLYRNQRPRCNTQLLPILSIEQIGREDDRHLKFTP